MCGDPYDRDEMLPEKLPKGEYSHIVRQGIISPPKVYYCTKCKEELSWSMTETFFCPCCKRSGLRHKGECQGTVVERDFALPRIY